MIYQKTILELFDEYGDIKRHIEDLENDLEFLDSTGDTEGAREVSYDIAEAKKERIDINEQIEVLLRDYLEEPAGRDLLDRIKSML